MQAMHDRRKFLFGGTALLAAASGAAAVAPRSGGARPRLFDCHTHFVSPDFEHYPLAIPPPIPGVPPNPATANLPERIRRNPTNVERVLELWDRAGVEAGVGVQYRTSYGVDNTYLLEVARAHADRIVPIVLLDPYDPTAEFALRSLVRDRGAAGVRFSAAADAQSKRHLWLDGPVAQRIWAAANELGAVIVLMPVPANSFDAGFLEAVARNARRFPRVDVVLDHFSWPPLRGAPDFGLTPEHLTLQPLGNVYFKLSSINLERLREAGLPAQDFVRHAVDVYGAGRILWGSDLGNTQEPYDELVTLALAATATLTAAEQRQVLHDTGKRVHVRGGRGRHA